MQEALKIALIAITAIIYLPGAIEDFLHREVDDIFIFLPYLSYIVTYFIFGIRVALFGVFMGIIIGIASYILFRYNYIASGDLLGLPAIFSAVYVLDFLPVFLSIITIFDLMRVYLKKKGLKIKKDKIKNEEKKFWLPEKQGSENNEKQDNSKTEFYQYGVPLLGYAFLAYFLSAVLYLIINFFI